MKKLKVLLVDDEPDFLKVIGTRIEEWGYDLVKAANGEEALKLVTDKRADIVIMDYLMPKMDGIQALKKIRRIDSAIPVIMFTAYPEKAMEGAERLGASAFIPKLSIFTDTMGSLKSSLEMIAKRLKK